MSTRTIKYSYRAAPTAVQQQWLAGAFGAVRVVYNSYIWDREQSFRNKDGSKPRNLCAVKDLPLNFEWLANYGSKVLQQSQRDAETAYRNYFSSLTNQRRNQVGKPQYKRKKSGGSIRWNGARSLQVRQISRKWGAVRLPKHGSWLKFRLTREFPSNPTGVTLKLSPAGEYTVSFTVKQDIAESKISGPTAGIDMGLIDLATVVKDDGSRYKISAPKTYRRAERKLARLQRSHSRKQKGSANREQARLALAKQHAHVAAQRLDLNRKIAYRLASENQTVSLEALNLKGLVRSKLSKSFMDTGLGQFATCVEQTAERLGTRFERVSPAYTSQTCAVCGTIDGPKDLSVREWECACGALLDRDYNAALNVLLLAGGHSERLNGSGGRVSREELAKPADSAMPVERVTSYVAHRPRRRRTRAKSQARRAQLKAQALV